MGYSVENSTASAWSTLLFALAYNLGGVLIILFLFGVGHRWRLWNRMLATRNAQGERMAPAKRLNSMFGWVRDVVRVQEDELVRVSGVDAAVFVRFCTFGIQYFVLLTVVVMPVLCLVYSLWGTADAQGITALSLSNVGNEDGVMWVSVGMLYLASAAMYLLLWSHSVQVWGLRHRFLTQRANQQLLQQQLKMRYGSADARPYTVLVAMARRIWMGGHMEEFSWLPPWMHPVWRFFVRLHVLPERAATFPPHETTSSAAFPAYKSVTAVAAAETDQPTASAAGAPAAAQKHEKREDQGLLGELNGADNGHGGGGWRSGSEPGDTHTREGGDDVGKKTGDGKEGGAEWEEDPTVVTERYFRRLFGSSLVHVQPTYDLREVIPAYRRWKHAVVMLNRCRMRWEQAVQKRRQSGAGGKQGTGAATKDASWHGDDEEAGGWPDSAGGGDGGGEEEEVDVWELMPRMKVGKKLGLFGGQEEDCVPYWVEQVRETAAALEKAQQEAPPITRAAFLTFRSQRSAALCVRADLSQGASGKRWVATEAPVPEEVWWTNLDTPVGGRPLRSVVATAYTVLMTIFFYIPVCLIASLATGQFMGTDIGQLDEEVQSTWLPPALQSIVPCLALHSVLWIFSPLFMVIARWEGATSQPAAMLVSSSRFYYVTVINILIAYSATSSLFAEMQTMLKGEQTVTGFLARAIPSNAAFYMQYTLNSTLMLGMELGRLPIHIVCYVAKLIVGKDISDAERLWYQGPMVYHVYVGYNNLILTFGIVFAVISPLILPMSLLYSCMAYVAWKHEVLYQYTGLSDSGGLYWPRFCHHMLNALLVAQLTAMGMFGSKEAYTAMSLAGLSIFLTLGVRALLDINYGGLYQRAVPLDVASRADTFLGTSEVPRDVAHTRSSRSIVNSKAPVGVRSAASSLGQEEGGKEAAEDDVAYEPPVGGAYFPLWMRSPRLAMPNLDLLAPSDPSIWRRQLSIYHDPALYYPALGEEVDGVVQKMDLDVLDSNEEGESESWEARQDKASLTAYRKLMQS